MTSQDVDICCGSEESVYESHGTNGINPVRYICLRVGNKRRRARRFSEGFAVLITTKNGEAMTNQEMNLLIIIIIAAVIFGPGLINFMLGCGLHEGCLP